MFQTSIRHPDHFLFWELARARSTTRQPERSIKRSEQRREPDRTDGRPTSARSAITKSAGRSRRNQSGPSRTKPGNPYSTFLESEHPLSRASYKHMRDTDHELIPWSHCRNHHTLCMTEHRRLRRRGDPEWRRTDLCREALFACVLQVLGRPYAQQLIMHDSIAKPYTLVSRRCQAKEGVNQIPLKLLNITSRNA